MFLPLPILRNNIIFVDTPGLNEGAARTRVTNSYLDKADAVIVLLDATKILAQNEQDLIADLCQKRKIQPIIVVNKIDAFTEKARISLERAVTAKLKKIEKFDINSVLYISALKALESKSKGNSALFRESGFYDFESVISTYIIQSRGDRTVKTASKLKSYLQSEIIDGFIPQQKLAFNSSKEEFQERYNKYLGSRGGLDRQIHSVISRLEDLKKEYLDKSKSLYEKFLAESIKATYTFVDDLNLSHNLSRFADVSKKREILVEIRTKFDSWYLARYDKWLSEVWMKEYIRFDFRMKMLADEAKKLHQALIEIQKDGTVKSKGKEEEEETNYYGGDDFSTAELVAIVAGTIIIGIPLAIASLPFLPFYFLGKWIYGAKKAEEDIKMAAIEMIITDLEKSSPERVQKFLDEIGGRLDEQHKNIHGPLTLKLQEIDKEFKDKQQIFQSDQKRLLADKQKLDNFESYVINLQLEVDSCLSFLQQF